MFPDFLVHTIKPQDALKIGQEVDVKILDIKGEKISLSLKALQENPLCSPWTKSKKAIPWIAGTAFTQFGAFAEIKPGVEGLIPVSEMSRNRNVGHPVKSSRK